MIDAALKTPNRNTATNLTRCYVPINTLSEKLSIRNTTEHTQETSIAPNWLYFRIPYVSDAVHRKIKRFVKQEEIPIRIVHKSTTLRQVLPPPPTETRRL